MSDLLDQLKANRASKPEQFGCVKCGECCRHASSFPGFPEPLNADGSCSHLTADGLCSIYDNRPDACRVGKFGHAAIGLTQEQWHDVNYAACEQLITIGRK